MLFLPAVLLSNDRIVTPLPWVACRDTTRPAAPSDRRRPVTFAYLRLERGLEGPSCQAGARGWKEAVPAAMVVIWIRCKGLPAANPSPWASRLDLTIRLPI